MTPDKQEITPLRTLPRIHIVGRKNSGKTTVVCDLVREFTRRGLRVATVKHTHHAHELDTPGKDSHMHRESGAAGVGILSPRMTAAFVPVDREGDETQRYAAFNIMFNNCDLILVEGDLNTTAIKIEVWRNSVGEPPYASDNESISAVISDDEIEMSRDRWPRGDVEELAARILNLAGISE